MTKKTTLTPAERRSLTYKAKDEKALAVNAELASKLMTPSSHNQRITDAHVTIVMARLSEGDTIKQVCRELGISSGLLKEYIRTNGDRYETAWRLARQDCAYAMVDSMVEVAWDDSESAERSKVKIDVLKWIAERFNRDAFSPRHQVDIRQAVTYVLPSDADDY